MLGNFEAKRNVYFIFFSPLLKKRSRATALFQKAPIFEKKSVSRQQEHNYYARTLAEKFSGGSNGKKTEK